MPKCIFSYMRHISAINKESTKDAPNVADLVPSLNHTLMKYESMRNKFQIKIFSLNRPTGPIQS